MNQTIGQAMRSFQCRSCHGGIQIPYDLPPTSAPCPHCGVIITSPPPDPGLVADGPGPPEACGVDLRHGEQSCPPEKGGVPPRSEGPSIPAPDGVTEPSDPAKTNSASDTEEDLGWSEGVRRKKIHPAIAFLSAVLVIVGVLVTLVVLNRTDPELAPPVGLHQAESISAGPVKDQAARRELFLKDGWKLATTRSLTGFLRAATPEAKAGFVIGGEAKLGEMNDFYMGSSTVDESDTPIDSFSHFDLDIVDKRRGLFLMRFERPPQVRMSEFFRPVVPLKVQHDLAEPGLLVSAFAARERFSMEPLRVMAFFKEEGDEILLDWDVYAQTKYRRFKHFTMEPRPGQAAVFRVMVREAVPLAEDGESSGARFYRLSDPAFYNDEVTIPVPSAELPGRILSALAWIGLPDRRAENRYATVRLAWTGGPESRLRVEEVICWEFLGLGGVAGNADPISEPVAGLGETPAGSSLTGNSVLGEEDGIGVEPVSTGKGQPEPAGQKGVVRPGQELENRESSGVSETP